MAITTWVSLWWFTEALPIAITSLLPFVLIPAMGLVSTKEIAREYMDPVLFLFLGGFLFAIALEKWDLHRRMALSILSRVGKSPGLVLAGVMLTAYLISNWISNTATTMMLFAAVMAVVSILEKHEGVSNHPGKNKIASGLFIGLAYAASIGGMATLVGTPPNMIFFRYISDAYPGRQLITFGSWMQFGIPVSLLILSGCYLLLRWMFFKNTHKIKFHPQTFKSEKAALGKPGPEQIIIGSLFALTAILWVTRESLELGTFNLPGWSLIFPFPENIHDGTVAISMAILLFLIPSASKNGSTLLEWKDTSKIPYHILLLFGGGFALSKGIDASGLGQWLAAKLEGLGHASPFVLILVVCLLVTMISEFASNVASVQLVLPILLVLSQTLHLNPLLLMVPATLSASLGFMLPVATAPNTIAFSSGRIKTPEMMSAGLILNLWGILVITCWIYFFS